MVTLYDEEEESSETARMMSLPKEQQAEQHFPLLSDEEIPAELGYEMSPPPHEDRDPIGTYRNGKKRVAQSSSAPGTLLIDFS
jgi:hypothetical protein